jgi:uncharacterized membrane protein YczE
MQKNLLKSFFSRLFIMILGLLLFGFGVALTIKANIGYAPWDVFHAGIALKTGLSIGIVAVAVGLIFIVIVTLLKEKLGLASILNMLLVGLFLDVFLLVLPTAENLIFGIIMLIVGLFVVSLGSYFYIKSALGVGPRDNLMVVLVRRTKLPAGVCRIIIEILVTVSGWLLGGMVGIGTVISAFGIGFCIQIVFKIFKFDVTAIKHESLSETFAKFKRKPLEE